MSGFRITEQFETYKEALQAVEGVDPPSVGFTKIDQGGTVTNISKIIKQNNLIIQLLATIAEESKNTKEELGEIKRGINSLLKNKEATDTLEEVVKKLENWKPGETSKSLVEKKKGPFYVFEDPKKIYEKELEKSKRK